MSMLNKLHIGDCLDIMKTIPNQFVDMVLADLPYGTTANSWDSIIPFAPLWEQYLRVAKDAAPFILMASQPFTTALINSAPDLFRYSWIWDKTKGGGFINAKKQPLKSHEDILVFYRKQPTYNPIMEIRGKPRKKGGGKASTNTGIVPSISYNNEYYPKSILTCSTGSRVDQFHPTQKPVELFEYLIKTYSNPENVILDNCAGSCTTAIASINTNRNWICIEQDNDYAEKSLKRIADHTQSLPCPA